MMMIDALDPAVLAQRLAAATEEVRHQYGDSAFEVSREACAIHEASHAILCACEGIRVSGAEVFRTPEPGPAAGSGEAGFRFGVIHARGWKWKADGRDPQSDLSEARYVIAGRVGELLSPWGKPGAALDELVWSQAIAAVAAEKMKFDAHHLWVLEVRAKTKKIIRANQDIVDAIAAKLIADGFILRRRLRELLKSVRRVE